MPEPLPKLDLMSVKFDAVTERQCVQYVLDSLDEGLGGWVVTMNLDHVRRTVLERSYRELCVDADVNVADGMILVWASALQGTRLPERVAGSDLINSLTEFAAERGRSVFFLGGEEGTAEEASKILRERHPELKVAGTYYPPMGFEKDSNALEDMKNAIVAAAPDIIYVALGSPKQEILIKDLRAIMPTSWWMGVGISFSFVCGRVQRAPEWVQKFGLEWLHRLVQEPGRLAKRYLLHGIPFAAVLLACSLLRGLGRIVGIGKYRS